MLILERKRDEEVVIEHPAGPIVVKVTDISYSARAAGRVKLGFEAPREVAIHRREVADRIESGEPFEPNGNK